MNLCCTVPKQIIARMNIDRTWIFQGAQLHSFTHFSCGLFFSPLTAARTCLSLRTVLKARFIKVHSDRRASVSRLAALVFHDEEYPLHVAWGRDGCGEDLLLEEVLEVPRSVTRRHQHPWNIPVSVRAHTQLLKVSHCQSVGKISFCPAKQSHCLDLNW